MQDRIKLPLHPDACSVDGWSADEQRVLRDFAQAVARDIIAACHERDLWCMDDPAATVEDVIRARFGLGE